MIYLDNSATSYPKPKIVVQSVFEAYNKFGGNSGRGAYDMALKTTEQIYLCRKKLAEMFGVPSVENVIITYNCTTALNMAIKGLAKAGSHFIISDLEHNAVLRPLAKLKNQGIADFSIACVENDVYKTVQNFKNCIKENTVAIVCTGASNVFGVIPPYRMLARLAHRNNLLFVMDCAQVAGSMPINMMRDEIDILCCAGHKGLMGPAGTGIMILKEGVELDTIIEGGTGSNSADKNQPENLPDRFESGTPNVQGIIGLSKALDYIKSVGVENIYYHEFSLMRYLQKRLQQNKNVILYTDFFDKRQNLMPIMSFNVKNKHSEEVAAVLSADGIAVRAGLHCAPLAHRKFKTDAIGTVRISPSVFTKKSDIDFLINSVRKIAK